MKAGDYEAFDRWVLEKWPDQHFEAWDRYRAWLLDHLKKKRLEYALIVTESTIWWSGVPN